MKLPDSLTISHLKLGNLIAIYDDNSESPDDVDDRVPEPNFPEITIDGDTAVSFTEDVEARYKAYGWNVLHVENGDE